LFSSIFGLATCLILYFTGMPSPQAGTIGMGVSLVVSPLVSIANGSKQKSH
jgi:hypothetical protein